MLRNLATLINVAIGSANRFAVGTHSRSAKTTKQSLSPGCTLSADGGIRLPVSFCISAESNALFAESHSHGHGRTVMAAFSEKKVESSLPGIFCPTMFACLS
ncbi:hypothetical protein H6P81_015491 [Aristolochia fimbriata]|uniref:Secreted protein n=1 Tax=Aristolochia fimbriata TaxID=158543 RepID=A0AAV7E8M0_ARIFI|nr:hypothetical protein H6P81_015491 [Aristolochia fimbriata]